MTIMLPYLHPATAALILVLLGYVGSLGLRARSDRRRAAGYLRTHVRWAPAMFWLVVATWIAGFLSTWLLRSDLDLAGSTHFEIGTALVLALSGGALTSRWMQRAEVRALHPWFGAAAMLLAAAQVFFGLQITP